MSKGLGVVITGIILSVSGVALAGVCLKPAHDAYKKLGKMIEGQIELKENKKISIEMDAGTMNVMHSDTETSYVKYNVLEYYKVKYDEEENELKVKANWAWNLIPFTWNGDNKSVVDVYLTEKDYDAYLELNAGKFNIKDDFNFSSLTIDVSAGSFNCDGNINVSGDAVFKISAGELNVNKDVKVDGKATVKVSAGDMAFKNLEASKTDIKISAGDIVMKKLTSDDIEFDISAGDLTININGVKSDYNIKIDESAGSCTIDGRRVHDDYETDGGSKRLDGDISAGKATITFVG